MLKMRQTVLCVDDDHFYLVAHRMYLEARGYCVLTASDGETALEMLCRERPDALIADIDMPGMRGDELVIRASHCAPNVPLIVCSGMADKEDVRKAQCLGAWGYVPKEVAYFANLAECLERCLREARAKGKDSRGLSRGAVVPVA